MTSFAPLKNYCLSIMDGMIERHGLKAPFLDAGCGQGDVAKHLAQRAWRGMAIDRSEAATQRATENLKNSNVDVRCCDIQDVTESFATIVSLHVIEHVRDDAAMVRHFFERLLPGGFLLLAVPTNPLSEWRWDDDFYGHYRRYSKEGLETLLSQNGFQMLEFCDYTFPFFWAMRRLYTRLFPVKKPQGATPEDNTALSSLQNAYDLGVTARLVAALPIWGVVAWLQTFFRYGQRGFEAVILAQRKD